MAKVLPYDKVEIAECDERIKAAWAKLRDDPKADPVVCRKEIDIWLDARLRMMDGKKRGRKP